eukprot:3579925-Pyramimonas_sp.AAC.1
MHSEAAKGNISVEVVAWLAMLATTRKVWRMIGKEFQSRMFEHPALDVATRVCKACCVFAYMGAFVDSPVLPRAVHLLTTVPRTVCPKLERKKPQTGFSKSQMAHHFYEKKKAGGAPDPIFVP